MDDIKSLKTLLTNIIQRHATPEAFSWISEKATGIAAEGAAGSLLNTAFAAVPRQTGNNNISLLPEEKRLLQSALPIEGWTLDRLCRVWLLLSVDSSDKAIYIRKIENLFAAAAMNELVALYSALPLLAYPEAWRARCAEGIRSNVGTVLQAIMCNNIYPSQQLEENAWNQMVLKAFFTEKPVQQIVGLDERRNQELAQILSDYAHERWAAGRDVNVQLWRCIVPFVDEKLFADIQRLALSGNERERQAAALVCLQTTYEPAKALLQNELKSYANDHQLSWQMLAEGESIAV